MSFKGKNALITGSSRGIGRGIALKLAEKGARVAVHYYRNRNAAQATLKHIRELGSDGFLVQADVCHPDEVTHIFRQVRSEFGSLDIFVSNARTEAPTFYQAPMELTLDKWDTAVDSQAKAFLVAVREAAPLMSDGGRIVAITYAPGGRFGSWQPWVAMGAAKAAMEVLVRYFAVALASRGITVNTISPGWIEDSVLNSLPEVFQTGVREWQERGWTPMGRLGTPAGIPGRSQTEKSGSRIEEKSRLGRVRRHEAATNRDRNSPSRRLGGAAVNRCDRPVLTAGFSPELSV